MDIVLRPKIAMMTLFNAASTVQDLFDMSLRFKDERTEWHNVVFFGKLVEIAGEWLSKGSNVYVEGSLKAEKWEDRDGNRSHKERNICVIIFWNRCNQKSGVLFLTLLWFTQSRFNPETWSPIALKPRPRCLSRRNPPKQDPPTLKLPRAKLFAFIVRRHRLWPTASTGKPMAFCVGGQ